jgi:hypothetical protein
VNEGNINLRMAKVIPIAAVIAASAFIGWRISAAVDYIADACFRDSIIGASNPNVVTLPAAIAEIAYQNKPTLSAVPEAGSITGGTSPVSDVSPASSTGDGVWRVIAISLPRD